MERGWVAVDVVVALLLWASCTLCILGDTTRRGL